MVGRLYAKWMFDWEYALTTRDSNRIVRPLEWGFDWLPRLGDAEGYADDQARMIALSGQIAADSDAFFGYRTPTDFRLERRYPELYPTNVRPETLAKDAEMKRQAATGELAQAEFLRFTSAVRSPYAENDEVNARWYPAAARKNGAGGRQARRQALIVLPQWNADGLSHNALCEIFNRCGISCLRLSKPYHDIRRPKELERSDYAVSANIGRTMAACRQGVVDIRSCCDWLNAQGYDQLGILGTSLGSCYAFIAAAHDPRLQVCAFNHASTSFGDVVWTGQSTRHIREGFAQAGLTQETLREVFQAISPSAYMERYAATPRRSLVVYATYDLTFIEQFSLDVLKSFDRLGVEYEAKVLPCGHYSTGETPFKYLDAWYLSTFIRASFRRWAAEDGVGGKAGE